MTRSTVHDAIDFQGVIQGCPDHQWLLTDALYDTMSEVPTDATPRWVVLSRIADASPSTRECDGYESHYQAYDLEEGWSISARSASALARRIREHSSESPPTAP